MDRRYFLGSLTSLAAAAMPLGHALAAAPEAHAAASAGQYPAIAATAADCIKAGQVCIDHCLTMLGQGNKAMAACARSVQQTLALCTALQQLAVQNSPYLPGLAKVAMQACLDCEKECLKHDKMPVCKACADACAACARECKALAV